jgi:hypothetical protein
LVAVACFLPGRAKDLAAPRIYIFLRIRIGRFLSVPCECNNVGVASTVSIFRANVCTCLLWVYDNVF